MSQWVLNEKGNVLSQQTLRQLTKEELLSNTELMKRNTLGKVIRSKLGDSMNPPPTPIDLDEENFNPEEE